MHNVYVLWQGLNSWPPVYLPSALPYCATQVDTTVHNLDTNIILTWGKGTRKSRIHNGEIGDPVNIHVSTGWPSHCRCGATTVCPKMSTSRGCTIIDMLVVTTSLRTKSSTGQYSYLKKFANMNCKLVGYHVDCKVKIKW